MQDHIGGREDAFGVENASRRAKERQQFGSAPTLILMRLQERMAFGLPRGPRLRDGLVRPRFIFVQLHNPRRFRLLARQLNQSFFSGVSRSYTVTVPLLRLRRA